jgi:hypothetical protein
MPNHGRPNLNILGVLDHMRILDDTMSSSSWCAELWLRQNAGQTGSGEPDVPCHHALPRRNDSKLKGQLYLPGASSIRTAKLFQGHCQQSAPKGLRAHGEQSFCKSTSPGSPSCLCRTHVMPSAGPSRSAVTTRHSLETLRCRNTIFKSMRKQQCSQ